MIVTMGLIAAEYSGESVKEFPELAGIVVVHEAGEAKDCYNLMLESSGHIRRSTPG